MLPQRSKSRLHAHECCRSVLIVSSRFTSALGTGASTSIGSPIRRRLTGSTSEVIVLMFLSAFSSSLFCSRGWLRVPLRVSHLCVSAKIVLSPKSLPTCLGLRPRLVRLRCPPSRLPRLEGQVQEACPASSTSASVVSWRLLGGSLLTNVVR